MPCFLFFTPCFSLSLSCLSFSSLFLLFLRKVPSSSISLIRTMCINNKTVKYNFFFVIILKRFSLLFFVGKLDEVNQGWRVIQTGGDARALLLGIGTEGGSSQPGQRRRIVGTREQKLHDPRIVNFSQKMRLEDPVAWIPIVQTPIGSGGQQGLH